MKSLIVAAMMISGTFMMGQSVQDSVIVEGKSYTLHKVQKGETLYGICNKYKVEMTEVIVQNRIGANGYTLAEGEILTIPLYAKKNRTDLGDLQAVEAGYITHVVKKGETLYSISRNYNGVTPDMIRWKNNLHGDALKINQQLLIPQEINTGNNNQMPGGDAGFPSRGNEKRALSDLFKKYNASEKSAENIEVSRGIATWFDNDQTENQKNFFALHRYAPIGTMLKVRNLMNNKLAYVKVIGKLPEGDESKSVVIKVSSAAARQLHVLDEKFLVELTIPEGKIHSTP